MSDTAYAFSLGCNARLKGMPEEANPYGDGHEKDTVAFRLGWRHCHRCWGVSVNRRWPVRPLPPVRQPVEALEGS